MAGGAAINALGKRAFLEFDLVVLGLADPMPRPVATAHVREIHWHELAPGSSDMTVEPARSDAAFAQALGIGLDLVTRAANDGVKVVCLGEMGIGNTTAAAAVTAGLTGKSAADVTGRGTGLDDEGLKHKVVVIGRSARPALAGCRLRSPQGHGHL